MKKQISLVLGLAVLSVPAFASKARLEALGEDADGSMFISDARNIFLNPAAANMYKDFVSYEWGNTTNSTDAASSPRAEGGVLMSSGSMVYGLWLGHESNTSNTLRNAATGSTALGERNNINVFIAGDAGTQWGVNIKHGSFKDEQSATEEEGTSSAITAGAVFGNFDVFLNSGLANTAETTTAEFTGKSALDLGVTYNLGHLDIMARVQTISAEDKGGEKYSATNTHVGVAKAYKLNEKANMWVSAWYKMDTSDNEFTSSGAPGETKSTYLPVAIALEVAAKDWLTFRGSVTQDVMISETEDDGGDKKPHSTGAVVTAGASIVWGDFQIDGMIGNNDDTGTVPGNDTSAGDGTVRTDTLMSRVSMTYRF